MLRSDSLHALDPEAQRRLLDLGVRTIVDLRRPDELERRPNVFATSSDVRYLHHPIFEESKPSAEWPATLFELYREMLDERGRFVAHTFASLAQPDAMPALVHCTVGKDRTGIVVALLLAVAGVSNETIVEDYALTAEHLTEAYFEEQRRSVEAVGENWARIEPFFRSPAEAMHRTLVHLEDRYGGPVAYLRTVGLTDDQLARLHAALVE
jgi:protein-tyrosine phosphatase